MTPMRWFSPRSINAGSPAMKEEAMLRTNGSVESDASTERYSRSMKPQFWMEGEVMPKVASERNRQIRLHNAEKSYASRYQNHRHSRRNSCCIEEAHLPDRCLEGHLTNYATQLPNKPNFDDCDKQAVSQKEARRHRKSSTNPAPEELEWYERTRTWFLVALMALSMAGIAFGVVFGLQMRNNKNFLNRAINGPDSCSLSFCNGTLCAQIFSAVSHDDPAAVDLFAAAADGSLWYIETQGRGNGNWIGLGGQLPSSPAAVLWNDSQRLDVFGLDSGMNVVYKTFENQQWTDWNSLGVNALSTVLTCQSTFETNRADIWALVESNSEQVVLHNYWDINRKDWVDNGTHPAGHNWDPSSSQPLIKNTSSTPAITCRNNEIMYDMVIYDNSTSAVLHRQWSNSKSRWLDWSDRGGSFRGDPVLFSVSDSRVDFFGIGRDFAMYHFTWSNSSGYSELRNLGGKWSSIPSVVSSMDDRVDVVALGSDGKLKHRALVGSIWGKDWQDLGVMVRSAPLAVDYKSTASIGVFALDDSGEVLRGDYRIDADGSWQVMSAFRGIGGDFSQSY